MGSREEIEENGDNALVITGKRKRRTSNDNKNLYIAVDDSKFDEIMK